MRHPRRCAQRGELLSSVPPSLSFRKILNRIMRFRINFIAPSVCSTSLEPLPSPTNFGIPSAPKAGSWQSRNFFMRFADGELLGDVPPNAAAAKLSAGVTVVLVGINFVYSTLSATGAFKSFLCRNKLHPLTHADTFLTCQSILCRLSTRNLW